MKNEFDNILKPTIQIITFTVLSIIVFNYTDPKKNMEEVDENTDHNGSEVLIETNASSFLTDDDYVPVSTVPYQIVK